MLLGAIEIQLHISPASFIDGHDADGARHAPRDRRVMATQLHTASRGTRKKRRATTNPHACPHDRCTARALSLSLSLSPRIRPCMHASSICKFSLQNFVLFSRKGTAKNVVGEVDMPQRREAQRKFWSVWCVWHWADCSWTLSVSYTHLTLPTTAIV